MTELSEHRRVERLRPPWVSAVTRDAIRHFAWGTGDDNPLWTDLDHAGTSRWSGLIAPPCFLYGVDETTVAIGHPDRRRVYRSVDWTFFDIVREGSDLDASAWLTGESDTGGEVEQHGRVEFRVAGGGLVARAETRCLRPLEPATAIEDRPELQYSGEQLDAIERTILAEARRGGISRAWEATTVGDALGPLMKGPLSIMDVVAWCSATCGVVDDDAGQSEGGLHAQSATGPEQVAWMAQLVTDWMGDDAFLHCLNIELDECPPLGATTTISGRVIAVELAEGRPTARIELSATNQSGRETARGTAVVLQPSDEHGPVRLPIEYEALS